MTIRRGFYTRRDGLAGIDKVAGETVDFTLNWVYELKAGQIVVGASWTVPAGLTAAGEARTNTTTTKRIGGGGAAGTEYTVACAMTKNNGEIVPRTFVIRMVGAMS